MVVALVAHGALDAHAERKTVCTITINSSNEKEAFQRSLPPDRYQFVELVQKDNPRWLSDACRQNVQCDVLVISGHHDVEQGFFSDNVQVGEFLSIDAMEHASCSNACSGIFSRVKEVYLFGCNTLNPHSLPIDTAELARSFVREGRTPADAERLARALAARHDDNNRDRVRRIFKDVPVIYGFSAVAPLGPSAATLLAQHFQLDGTASVATGRTSASLVERFSAHGMVAVSGVHSGDAIDAFRGDVCEFADDRTSPAERLGFVQKLLDRNGAEARLFLDRLEKVANSLPPDAERTTDLAAALDNIVHDAKARARFLDFARDADDLTVRSRMFAVAQKLDWLTVEEQQAELVRMIDERMLPLPATPRDVNLACSLNRDEALSLMEEHWWAAPRPIDDVAHAAIRACLGSLDDRPRVLQALTSPRDDEGQIAQVYLVYRPIIDARELREVVAGIASMSATPAKIRALETLSHQSVSDPVALEALAEAFPAAESVGVQVAIAGVLLRAHYPEEDKPELIQTLRQYRRRSGSGEDLIDVLIRRLERSQ